MDSAEFDRRMAAIMESFERSRIADERNKAEYEHRLVEYERRQVEYECRQVEYEHRQVEYEHRQVEYERRQVELDRIMAETNKAMAEANKAIAEAGKEIKEMSKRMGGISENIGHHAEQFFQNVFEKKLEFGGIKYDEMIRNLRYKGRNDEIEFDIVLVNGDSIAIIEVKNRIHPNFVKELAEERMGIFRKYFRDFDGYSAYLGIAGFSFSEFVIEEASRYGVGVIRQVGDSMEMDAGKLKAY
ncbi:MAG: hypothetical protein FWH22_07780 [Fibromonadales bacterium]|nr:hypothetical protein [Fibromonadales bacterium]